MEHGLPTVPPPAAAVLPCPPSSVYPPAAATNDEVCADADKFWQTLRDLHKQMELQMPKVTKLGGAELDLHLLYSKVSSFGGAEAVIRDKRWRDVGDAFHLPSTITSVSYVLKKGYMTFLWDYEQVYFHRRSGQRRIPPPASKGSKDAADERATAHIKHAFYVPHVRHLTHGHLAVLEGGPAFDHGTSAAAMASAQLRAQHDWAMAAMEHARSSEAGPSARGGQLAFPAASSVTSHSHLPSFPPSPGLPPPGTLGHAPPLWATAAQQLQGTSGGDFPPQAATSRDAATVPFVTATPAAANMALTAVATAPGAPSLDLVGQRGDVVVDTVFQHGYFVTVSVGGQTFAGMLAFAPGARGTPGSGPSGASGPSVSASDSDAPPQKRLRAASPPGAPDRAAGAAPLIPPKLPETVFSLLMKHNAVHGGGGDLSADHAAGLWEKMPEHARRQLEGAVDADQARFRAEQGAYDRAVEARNATLLAAEQLQGAERLMAHLCSSQPPLSPLAHPPHPARVPPHLYRRQAQALAASEHPPAPPSAGANSISSAEAAVAGAAAAPPPQPPAPRKSGSSLPELFGAPDGAPRGAADENNGGNNNTDQAGGAAAPMDTSPLPPPTCEATQAAALDHWQGGAGAAAAAPFPRAPWPFAAPPEPSSAPPSGAVAAPSLADWRFGGLSGSLTFALDSAVDGGGKAAAAEGDAAEGASAAPPAPVWSLANVFDDSPFMERAPGEKVDLARIHGASSGPLASPNVVSRLFDPARHFAYPPAAAAAGDAAPDTRAVNVLQKDPQQWEHAGLWGGASISDLGFAGGGDFPMCMDKDDVHFFDDLVGADNDWAAGK